IDEHIERLDTILSRISEVGLKLKLSKCQLMQRQVSFSGTHCLSRRYRNGSAKDREGARLATSLRFKRIEVFCWFCSYYRRFIDGFAERASSLTNLTKKSVRFRWSEDCETAFEELKLRLVSAPVLGMPNDND